MKILLFSLLALVGCEGDINNSVNPNDENTWIFNLSPRQESSLNGEAFATAITPLELQEREEAIFNEIQNGNVPDFLKDTIVPIQFTHTLGDSLYDVTIYVMPDYMAIGNDSSYFLIPMTPILAQRVMDEIGGILPTRKMVDLIWSHAELKLEPSPIPPSDIMATVPVFRQHNNMVQTQRREHLDDFPLGALVAGHKKDVILSNRIASNPNKVIIYGWHYLTGNPIQPLYSGHVNWYADYSHGIRAVLAKCQINGATWNISDILKHPILYQLLSDETGLMESTRYDTSASNYP